MKAQHTPGPWRYEDSTETIRSIPGNHWIASMDSFDGAVDDDANAALIASAPDLLTALRVLVDHAQETYPHFESERGQRDIAAAIAAIAKATGTEA